jgi:hypothetical protein
MSNPCILATEKTPKRLIVISAMRILLLGTFWECDDSIIAALVVKLN